MTEQEYQALISRLLAQNSTDINTLPVAQSLENMVSFPALDIVANGLKLVPLSLIKADLDAAVASAQAAVRSANAAAAGWAIAQRKLLGQSAMSEDMMNEKIAEAQAALEQLQIILENIYTLVDNRLAAKGLVNTVYLTEDEYNALVDAGTVDVNTEYNIYEE